MPIINFFLKKLTKNFLFLPKFFSFIPAVNYKKEIRPYFGVNIFTTGGPYIRTKRLTKYFGNFLIKPNIIYAQSYWTDQEIIDCIKYSQKKNIPIIFNQNGWYYKSWFKGDYKYRNKLICKIQKISKLVLYQSNFCKKFSKKINNYYAKNSVILLNDVPNLPINKINNKNFFMVNAIFDENSGHLLLPAIKAFYKLAHTNNIANQGLKLIIVGIFKKSAKRSKWFDEYMCYYKLLSKEKLVEYRGSYNKKNANLILNDISYALHLKYNDPCPNKIIENLKRGIINIYSDSGGVRELVGNAGIPIKVKNYSTKKLYQVDVNILKEKILLALKNKNKLYKRTIQQSRKFNYKNYIKSHKDIFIKNLS